MSQSVLACLSFAATVFARTSLVIAHPPEAGAHLSARTWTNIRTGERIEGSFLAARGGTVALETSAGDLASIALEDLAGDDRAFADTRIALIRAANEVRIAQAAATAKPTQAAIFDAFGPFVKTRFDDRWLYIESDGFPHAPLETKMMVGIRAWQQQVPLPQPYTGANAWQIPLKPELAETPILGKNALMRGAVALAANGIPIFNALNNGGRDSYQIGELDEFGGHCGRGDDYHYHAAPLAIEKIVGKGQPIAYALDGFPIFGLFDPKAKKGEELACPCGSHEPLDEINGHFCEVPKGEGFGGGTRSYHYHASKTFPYINGGLRGKVEIEGSGTDTQVVPQPRANGVRPALPPLRGASITGFEQTGPKAWSLRYEIAAKASLVNYRVEDSGKVIFEFVGPDGEKRVEEHMPRARGGGGGPGGQPREGRGGQGAQADRQADRQGDRQADRQGARPRGGAGGAPPREAPAAAPKSGLSLSSTGVGLNGLLDAKHTCDGASISPPFAWSGLPAGTKSIALTIHHITTDNLERIYLVRFGIPPNVKSIAEGDKSVGTFGLNNVGRRAEYAPPCSQGPGEKTYIASLYALSTEPKFATATPTREELLAAIKDITLASGTLELRYSRTEGASGSPGAPERSRGQGRGGRSGDQVGDQAGGQAGERGGEQVGDSGAGAPKTAPRDPAPSGEQRSGGQRGSLIERMTAFKTDIPARELDVILARPTDTSIAVSIGLAKSADAIVEYWTDGDAPRAQSKSVAIAGGEIEVVELTGLKPSTEYRYRIGTTRDGAKSAAWGASNRFRTRAATGTPFTFTIQADSHLDQGVTPKCYEQTLANMLAAQPDFFVDLGDTFMTDKRGGNFTETRAQYDAQRYYFGLLCKSAPLFMVLGNHDGEKGTSGSRQSDIGPWSFHMRTERFPEPVIDAKASMYTGSTGFTNGRGANYYAFEWGDAQIIVLDPFWSTTERLRNGGGGAVGGGPGRGLGDGPALEPVESSWSSTLGRAQYDWLAETLANSKSKYKFVFIHHLVGGKGGSESRGGVESAPFFEWGGKNADGSDGFAAKRAGWPMPIHDLLVKHGVSVVFHGHDHLYVHSEMDGVHYQCVPQPGNLAGGTRSAEHYGYASGKILGSPGHVRVRVAPEGAKVEFVRTAISEADAAAGGGGAGGGRGRRGAQSEANGTVIDNYEITPREAGKVKE